MLSSAKRTLRAAKSPCKILISQFAMKWRKDLKLLNWNYLATREVIHSAGDLKGPAEEVARAQRLVRFIAVIAFVIGPPRRVLTAAAARRIGWRWRERRVTAAVDRIDQIRLTRSSSLKFGCARQIRIENLMEMKMNYQSATSRGNWIQLRQSPMIAPHRRCCNPAPFLMDCEVVLRRHVCAKARDEIR